MIIQSLSLLDTLDKEVNILCMHVREWYSWYFTELGKIVNDNYKYAKLVKSIKDKSSITNENLEGITKVIGDKTRPVKWSKLPKPPWVKMLHPST